MPVKPVEKIWMNGQLVDWDKAQIHILSHVVHYGSSWFEGIRCYKTANGPAIFRLGRHVKRLFDSTKIYHTAIPYTVDEITKAIYDTIRENKLTECYVRPVVYRGYGDVGVNPLPCPVDVTIAVWEWGEYLGSGALNEGITACVSTWQRPAANTFPSMAKAGGNYLLGQLMKIEAIERGCDEAIALDVNGNLSEGSGENLFAVKDKKIITPQITSSLLPGITRASVISLAKKAGYEVIVSTVPREMVYVADELFFTGTAAEVTPIKSVDGIPVGDGKPGPITMDLQQRFFKVVRDADDPDGWLSYVYND